MSRFKGKRVLIIGAKNTGYSLAKFFHKEGAQITVSDMKTRDKLGPVCDQMEEFEPIWELGGHTAKAFNNQDMAVFSPGVNHNDRVFDALRQKNIPILGELELAASLIREPVIAVTGTNGKSTVTRLIHEFLVASGVKSWIGGNYGPPLIDYVTDANPAQVVVSEVSSFQLELADTFRPQISVVINLAEDHFDRYKGGMPEYMNAKKRMFRNANPECVTILNADDNLVMEMARDPMVQRNKLRYISKKSGLEEQIKRIGGAIYTQREIRVHLDGRVEKFPTSKMKLKGRHNLDNIMAAIVAALPYGAKPEAIQKVLENFKGLEHRLEYVRTKGGVDFYNDSKSTNVSSMIAALEAFDEPIILIAGGRDKGMDFMPVTDLVKRKVKNLILIGEAKERLNRVIGDFSETFMIGTFEEAVFVAFQKSRSGDVILLSPGCSSFDKFINYEARGNYFKDLVSKL